MNLGKIEKFSLIGSIFAILLIPLDIIVSLLVLLITKFDFNMPDPVLYTEAIISLAMSISAIIVGIVLKIKYKKLGSKAVIAVIIGTINIALYIIFFLIMHLLMKIGSSMSNMG